MNKQLKSLDEHNEEVMCRHNGEEPLNGIACPLCGNELMDANTRGVLLSYPVQYEVHCSVCVWTGTRY
jgi:hypothetical protein